MKNVLFVASECTPFIKTGGLADVIGSLPKALKQYEQLDTRVILPLYDEIGQEWHGKMKHLASFDVQLGWRNQQTDVYLLKHEGITYYFIANDYYFTRKGIYGYYDDGERFIYFSQAVIEALSHINFKPDTLHAHDWQAGMAVALARITKPVEGMSTVFTIHNIQYQGVMPIGSFEDFFRLSREHIAGMEWNGMLNCLKSALFHADKVTTVSPTYAEEIQEEYYGEGLAPILRERSNDVTGILNGIDPKEYHPLTDPYLPVNYRTSRAKKKENKLALQKTSGLPQDEEVPVYVMVSRLVEQKGIHLIQHILEEFLEEEIQFIVLGTGEEEFENYFRWLADSYPDKAAAMLTFDEQASRLMYGGADFFLMPSKFEPCGLAQLIALQYKTVPIVRETGGLKDTVTPYNRLTGEGTGFSFSNYNAHELLHVLRLSLNVYQAENDWHLLSQNVNKSQFTWKESAREYKNMYDALTPIYG
ncbi:glycogen synthase GlgA [Virgibacillus xinjiangensis]|uniref:Glycogen synthase n=1 Tax=Virgibacillus xinjiangensis TaxID=393090 RepID=A0ABV7CZJ5_9BACI